MSAEIEFQQLKKLENLAKTFTISKEINEI